MPDSIRIVLASSSPRRRELLSLSGLPFEIAAPHVDESRLPGESPLAYVTRLSQLKARKAAGALDGEALVIAADTTVALGDEILGKPRDPDDARAMLARLRGRMHTVYSAISLIDTTSDREVSDLCATEVGMRSYTDAEIDAYVATGDPLDKAGAYAIQDRDFNPVPSIDHCFASVMGLPLCHLLRNLPALDLGFDSALEELPAACQAYLDYDCPVSASILANTLGGHHATSGL